jgi:hypothetical protein
LWQEATQGEAYLYLNKLKESQEHYQAAAALAGIREKISIHTNAYQAFLGLKGPSDDDHIFIQFLHQAFLR